MIYVFVIDLPNRPDLVVALGQETGRAGRDGLTSDCVLFYSYADTTQMQRMIDDGEGTREQKENNRANLRRMVQYCMNELDCRRVQVLHYFGDTGFTKEDCHKTCDNCRAGRDVVVQDVTAYAQDAVRLVQSMERDKGVTILYAVDVFRGSKQAKVRRHHSECRHSPLTRCSTIPFV